MLSGLTFEKGQGEYEGKFSGLFWNLFNGLFGRWNWYIWELLNKFTIWVDDLVLYQMR